MPVRFIPRSGQLNLRRPLSFTPIQIEKGQSLAQKGDSALDGVDLIAKTQPAHWIHENDVHRALKLSKNLGSTRHFLGAHYLATRDDVRKMSYVLVPEAEGLFVISLHRGEVFEKNLVTKERVQRAHIYLDKYTGKPHVFGIKINQGSWKIFIDDDVYDTNAELPDFPFLELSQAFIGHIQDRPSPFGIATYKCRKTGTLYVRRLLDGRLSEETPIKVGRTLGGMNLGISGSTVMFRLDLIEGDKVAPALFVSEDEGRTIGHFEKVDLSSARGDECLITHSSVVVDYLGNFQVPISIRRGNSKLMLNYLPETALVEALEIGELGDGMNIARFPKKVELAGVRVGEGESRFGNGVTDGLGIIATGVASGRLFVSNSQAGGIHFPEPTLLNHEMPKIFCFKSTECCYTRSVNPNMVSMDYLFVEADDSGQPESNHLFLDTWDMPLPEPVVEARQQGPVVEVKILSDAFFFPGQVSFEFGNPSIRIRSANIKSDRQAEVEIDASYDIRGTELVFESKSTFYYHRGKAVIC